MIDKRQSVCIVLGFCIFLSVVYLLSLHKTFRNSSFEAIKINAPRMKGLPKPNFIFILTDDQDDVMGSIEAMESVKKYIINKGITFKNSFVASPLCCPSRSSIFSGQYGHNHKVYNNSYNGGCSSESWQNGPERKSFVNSLHQSGYQTFFAGKYLNQYGTKEAGGLGHVPPGWDWWIGLEGNSRYYDYSISVNGTTERHGNDSTTDYFTNVIRKRALQFLNSGSLQPPNRPFFMMLSTPSCHAPFTPEPKYKDSLPNLKVPRTDNFNIANDDSKHWLLRLGEQPLRESFVKQLDEIHRQRLRTLLTVDDMVRDVVEILESKGLINSTYIIFTSDNGYHLGQFSMPLDKREPYEFDVRVPFAMRGPEISNSVSEHLLTNIDIAPTILDLAGVKIPSHFDGESFKHILTPSAGFEQVLTSNNGFEIVAEEVDIRENDLDFHFMSERYMNDIRNNRYDISDIRDKRKTVLIEHTGEYHEQSHGCEYLGSGLSGCDPNFACKCEDSKNNTYSCLRHICEKRNFVFCSWKDDENFEEFYNLNDDLYQLNNTVKTLRPEQHKKLLSILSNLKRCRGSRCRKLSKFVF